MMKITKNSGSSSIIRRCVWSMVGACIIRLDVSCVPRYSTISAIRVRPVAVFVRSWMNSQLDPLSPWQATVCPAASWSGML